MIDPCASTVINTWSTSPHSVRDGESAPKFKQAADTVQVYNNKPTLCGPREYSIVKPNGTAAGSWITVGPKTGSTGVYEIKSQPMDEVLETLHNFKLKILLTYYKDAPTNHAGLLIDFTVTVTSAVCECNRITYDPPAAQTLTTTVKLIPAATLTISHATQNAASKTAVPQTRKCGSTCGTTTVILSIVQTGSTMPNWMTLNSSTGVLTIDPNNNN